MLEEGKRLRYKRCKRGMFVFKEKHVEIDKRGMYCIMRKFSNGKIKKE